MAEQDNSEEEQKVRKAVDHVRRVGMFFIILLIVMMAAFLIAAYMAFHFN